ncbi:hypothetical protein D3C81_1860790 [compost metagenome]
MQEAQENRVYLKVEALGQSYSFYYATRPEAWETLLAGADGTLLSTDVAGGFTASIMGMYATAHGQRSANYADFDYFEYLPLSGE